MRRPKTLPAFTAEEFARAHDLLAAKVAFMMGRKFEEGDWTEVHSRAKGIPPRGWTNLDIDIAHAGLGIEHKMMRPGREVSELFGTRLMHPAATRSIRVSDGEANEVMRDVLGQYASLIERRTAKVATEGAPEMRTGWLLWQANLQQFLYFEEEMLAPDPADYTAEWHVTQARGARKASRSLWIYERETGQKRYSVTTEAGAKIQPYFDVPPASDPNVYLFITQGEEFRPGMIRVWVSSLIARELKRSLGSLEQAVVDQFVSSATRQEPEEADRRVTPDLESAEPLVMGRETYLMLCARFPNAVSDAHRMQLLVELAHPA